MHSLEITLDKNSKLIIWRKGRYSVTEQRPLRFLYISSALKGAEEGDFVGIFELAADRNAVGKARHTNLHGSQET